MIYPQFSLFPAPPFFSSMHQREQKHRKRRPETWPKSTAFEGQITGCGTTSTGGASPQIEPRLQNPAFPPQNHLSLHSAVVFVCSAQTTSSELFQLFVIGNAMQKIKYVNSSLCLPSILKGRWTIIFLPRDLKELQPQQLLGEQLVQKAAMAKPVRAHE